MTTKEQRDPDEDKGVIKGFVKDPDLVVPLNEEEDDKKNKNLKIVMIVLIISIPLILLFSFLIYLVISKNKEISKLTEKKI